MVTLNIKIIYIFTKFGDRCCDQITLDVIGYNSML